ncbi:hypothetical protein DVH24_018693 [Malus domestica]|uniref:non-specific serine/threonine protein kinase n=1 Tax=Malus domestica TaxID=3750 RepID=A0A498HIL4_MALDO|nr:hypothetical protein DVH24_018693 [Malus domestica]
MGANLFSGEIPPELGSLSSFQIAMNLSFNNFTGRIPPALGNLNLLEFLLLNNNHLTGEIPSTFESLSSLLGCNFSYNDLTGALPSTPLFQNMDLSSFIGFQSTSVQVHGKGFDWPTRFLIALGAAEGLAYLHHDCKPRVVHHDIKSNNILLDENFEAHVGDFGLAKVIDMRHSKSMSAVAGSYGYIAPGKSLPCVANRKNSSPMTRSRRPLGHLGETLCSRHSLTSGILDGRMSPFDRQSTREVVLMLFESNEQDGDFLPSPTFNLPSKDATDLLKDDADLPLTDDTRVHFGVVRECFA